jgi:hypothetical protein
MANMEHRGFVGSRLVRDAVVTLAGVLLAVLALDDITTDSAQSFPLERTALAACAVWFSIVAWRLWRQGHRVLGVLSFGLVTIGALVQPTIGPGTDPMQIGYLTTVAALAWFLLVAGLLAAFAWRPKRSHAAH